MKVLEILERDQLAQRAERLGGIFHDFITNLQRQYTCIGDVRGQGLMQGIEIVSDRETKQPDEKLGNALADRMLELGLSANVIRGIPGLGSCFRMAPPLNISEEDLMKGLHIIEEAFRTTPGVQTIA